MTTDPIREDPYYLQGRIERRLAEDPDSAELGVRVAVHAGEVYLTGDVASDERRRHVVAAAVAAAEGRRVHDELTVTCAEPPTSAEDLR